MKKKQGTTIYVEVIDRHPIPVPPIDFALHKRAQDKYKQYYYIRYPTDNKYGTLSRLLNTTNVISRCITRASYARLHRIMWKLLRENKGRLELPSYESLLAIRVAIGPEENAIDD